MWGLDESTEDPCPVQKSRLTHLYLKLHSYHLCLCFALLPNPASAGNHRGVTVSEVDELFVYIMDCALCVWFHFRVGFLCVCKIPTLCLILWSSKSAVKDYSVLSTPIGLKVLNFSKDCIPICTPMLSQMLSSPVRVISWGKAVEALVQNRLCSCPCAV